MKILSMIYLGMNAWTDFKRKEIDLIYTVFFVGAGFVYKLWNKSLCDWSGLLPGIFLLFLSLIWREQIGSGDGIVVLGVGWICGLSLICNVLLMSFALAACAGIVCLLRGRKGTVQLPFVPFLLCSYMFQIYVRGVVV